MTLVIVGRIVTSTFREPVIVPTSSLRIGRRQRAAAG
jgi:hypothetical protein